MEVDSDDERANSSAIFTAIRNRDLKKVTELLEKVDVHVVDRNNKDNSPLHYAVEQNCKTIVEAMLRLKWAELINATNRNGDTPLHLAAYKGHREIIILLLSMGAKDSVENKHRQKPVDIAKNRRMRQIFQMFHDRSFEDGNIDAWLANESEEQVPYEKKPGASGMRGQIYEISFAMLFLLHGTLENEEGKMDRFLLAANLKPAGDFDDVVYKRVYRAANVKDMPRSRVLFMQSKHKNREGEIVPMKKLLSMDDKKEDFSLKNYHRSYGEIRDRFTEENAKDPIFESKLEDCEFVIFTNALLGDYEEYEDHVRREIVEEDSLFNFGTTNSYFKLSLDGSRKEELMRVMRSSSHCLKLAEELTEAVFSAKGVDLLKYTTKNYHWALASYVLEGKKANGKLRETFLDGHDATVFSKTFFSELAKRPEFDGKSLDETKQFLRGKKIKLPNNFGTIKPNDQKLMLPIDVVTENKVNDFFGKLKLFFEQPNDVGIGMIIRKRLGEAYRVMQPDMDTVYAEVQDKVKSWWLNKNVYLTEDNRFYEETAKISLWFDVMEPVRFFTGRKSELRELNETLLRNRDQESRMTCLGGLSGVGKTELVRKYIRRYSREYDDNIVWINAETEESTLASFRKLARDKLNLPANTDEDECEDVKSIVAKIYAFFSKRNSLFVFDCVDELESIRAFLPPCDRTPGTQRPCVLLTSCNDCWDDGIKTIRLGPFTPMEAEAFVLESLKETREDSKNERISKLVELLHCFPIAIERAVSYIRDETWTRTFTINDYIEMYEKRWEELMKSEKLRDIETDCERAAVVTAIFDLDKQNLTQRGRTAFEVLRND